MIDIRDLQIGSYIQGGPNTYRVIGINENGTVDIEWRKESEILTWQGYELDRYEPIPITKSLLKQLGIKQKLGERLYCHHKYNWVIQLPASEDHDTQLWDGEWHASVTSIHHLQALIWNLERVWLTLSPETP